MRKSITPADIKLPDDSRLTILEIILVNNRTMARCACDCGSEKTVLFSSVKNGNTKSCGCKKLEQLIERSTTHGQAGKAKMSPSYISWRNMVQRCTNPKHPQYKDYGGRNIEICPEWMEFQNFFNDMGPVPEGKSIDRINVNEHYCQSNCRWATKSEQARNRRHNLYVQYEGHTMLVIELAERFGMCRRILRERLILGWTAERALSTPVKIRQHLLS